MKLILSDSVIDHMRYISGLTILRVAILYDRHHPIDFIGYDVNILSKALIFFTYSLSLQLSQIVKKIVWRRNAKKNCESARVKEDKEAQTGLGFRFMAIVWHLAWCSSTGDNLEASSIEK